MQTILGAGGPVSNDLASLLTTRNIPVRLASRRPVPASGSATWLRTDLLHYPDVLAAARDASILYMCAGLQYNNKVWIEQWPLIMDNLIQAAQETGARLIFFDNVYMYGHVQGAMKEDTPYHPASVKGEVRARIAGKLMNEAAAGRVKASMARAADFYGAKSLNSFLDSMMLVKYRQKARGMWLGNPDSLHSFTYIPDAARGMVILGEHPESDNQIWHLPTAPALTGRQFIKLAADVFQSKPSYTRVSKLMLQLMGLFNKTIGETAELYYQYQYDYIFDSGKFEKTFGVKPTAYEEGFRELAKSGW